MAQSTTTRPPHDPTGGLRPALAGTRLWESILLSPEERQALADAVLWPRRVEANTDLLHEGARPDNLLIFTAGWACRYMVTRDGSRQIPAVLVPGDIGNIDSLLLDRLDYGVRTLTATTVVPLPRDRAVTLAAQHPGIAQTFIWLALIENAILSKWALSLGRRSARERLAHLICELSVRLGGEAGNRSSFDYPLTQEQAADALGLTSVHVNRTLQQLRADGLIATESRKIFLPDVARLRQVAGFSPAYLHIDAPMLIVPDR